MVPIGLSNLASWAYDLALGGNAFMIDAVVVEEDTTLSIGSGSLMPLWTVVVVAAAATCCGSFSKCFDCVLVLDLDTLIGKLPLAFVESDLRDNSRFCKW